MGNSNSQNTNSHILPVMAAFLSASMSVFFSRLYLSNTVYENSLDIGSFITIITTIILYFFVFYSISEILISKTISPRLFGRIFMSSIFLILIGLSDIGGIFIRIFLWVLVAILLPSLWKTKSIKVRDLYCNLLFPLLISSTAYPFIFSSELIIEEEQIRLENIEYNGDGFFKATFSLRINVLNQNMDSIIIKFICSDQVTLDENECALLNIDNLKKNGEEPIEWNIIFDDADNCSFFLQITSNAKFFNKKITIQREDGQWNTKIEDAGFAYNILIFIKNNSFLSF